MVRCVCSWQKGVISTGMALLFLARWARHLER